MNRRYTLPIALILLIGLASCVQEPATSEQPEVDRKAAIPSDAMKFDPSRDQAPPILHDPAFQEPVPLPGPFNTAGAEDSPFITPDGKTLFFFFSPTIEETPEEELVEGVAGIYWSHLESGEWSKPERLFLIEAGELSLDGCPAFWNGELWFCSARQGNFRGVDFWIAQLDSDGMSSVQNSGRLLNEDYQIGEMHLSADGSEIYFHGTYPAGMGGIDLWMTHQSGAGWSVPVNLEILNSPEDEGWPFVSSDGMEFWFTRWYQGSPAIFRSKRLESGWGQPELIVSQFAGEPTLDDTGNLYFVHHFLDQGQLVEADLYLALRR